jgi:hypothetical protein
LLYDLWHGEAQLALQIVDKEHGAAIAVGVIVAMDGATGLQGTAGEVLGNPVLAELRVGYGAAGVDGRVGCEPCIDEAAAVLRVQQLCCHPRKTFAAAVETIPWPLEAHQDFDHLGHENAQNAIVGCTQIRIDSHLRVTGGIAGIDASSDGLDQCDDDAVGGAESRAHRDAEPVA